MRRNKFVFTLVICLFTVNTFIYPNEVIAVKEVVNYKIRYGFIIGGDVEFRTEVKRLDGDLFYNTRITAKTSGIIDQLYKLYDIYESYYDINTGLPHLAIRNINEGKYHAYDEVTYTQKKLQAHSSRKDTTYKLEKPTYDIISAIQYLRKQNWENLKDGETIEITTLYDKEPFPIYAIYRGIETITLGSNQYRCHKFTPLIDPGKILKKKEDLTIWFSDDENRIPINIKLNLVVGSFRLEFENYSELPFPLTSQTSKK